MSKHESPETKKAKAEIKENKKKENKVKNAQLKNKLKTVATVIVTLAVVIFGYFLYMQGYNHGVQDQKTISNEVKSKVDELAVTLKHNVK